MILADCGSINLSPNRPNARFRPAQIFTFETVLNKLETVSFYMQTPCQRICTAR